MTNRPRSHIIEERSRNRLREVFNQYGWVVWDLSPDYGEDQLVRIFIEQKATQYSFFVQAKSTDHIDKKMHKNGRSLSFPIETGHIEHWERFWEPVILTVWDTQSDITYWEVVQDFLASFEIDKYRKRKKISIHIPTDNTFPMP